MTRKVMRLLNQETGLMECEMCGTQHQAKMSLKGKIAKHFWFCQNNCRSKEKTLEVQDE